MAINSQKVANVTEKVAGATIGTAISVADGLLCGAFSLFGAVKNTQTFRGIAKALDDSDPASTDNPVGSKTSD